jgi:hypothetical protein
LADDLETKMGFTVERGKKRLGKLPRPVFFGDEGSYLRTYEIDAFDPTIGIALEVEAGRATMGNAIYRDLIQGSSMLDSWRWLSRWNTVTNRAFDWRASRAMLRRTR